MLSPTRPAAWFFLSLGVFLLTSRGLQVADNLVHFDTARGIVERGSIELSFDPGAEENCLLATTGKSGRPVSSLWPGTALFSLPLIAAGSLVTAVLGEPVENIEEKMSAFYAPRKRIQHIQAFREINLDYRLKAFSLLSPLSGATVVAFFVKAANMSALSPASIAVTAAALLLATPLLVYGGSCWTQALAAALCAWAFYLWLLLKRARSRRRIFLFGLSLSLAALVRPEFIVLTPLTVAGIFFTKKAGWRERLGEILFFALPILFFLAASLAWNILRFGSPAGPGCAFQSEGWSLAGFPDAFLGQLLNPDSGLLIFLPLLALFPGGMSFLARSRPWAAWAGLSSFLAMLVFYSFYWDWNAHMSYGPRRLVPLLMPLMLPLAAWWQKSGRAGKALFLALLSLGALVQIPGALLSAQKLPDVSPELVWERLSWFVGWAVLFKGAYAAAGDSLFGGTIECLSGQSAFFLSAGVVSLLLGMILAAVPAPTSHPPLDRLPLRGSGGTNLGR